MEDKLLATRLLIKDLKQQVEFDIDVSDDIKYTDEQIEKLLKKLPVVMFQAAQTIVLRLIDFKEAKRKLKKEIAKQTMNANANGDLTAAPDRKAWAESRPEVETAEIELINAEAEYKMAELHYDSYDNLFTAIKKLSTMRAEQNKLQNTNY